MMKAVLTTLALVLGASIASAEEPFRDLDYEKALKTAKKEGKIVLIDFYTTWCAPCKMLDKTTWKDKKVRAWLKEKAVALKIDAEKETKLAEQHRITTYPTILLLKSDGTEIDRLGGYRDAATFLSEAKDALAGRDSLTRAKEKLAGDGKNDPMGRMDYARILGQKGKYKEALEEYLWCFDHGHEHGPGFAGVRLSFLLGDIVGLGQVHPPAIKALKDRRNAAEEAILKRLKKAGRGGLLRPGRSNDVFDRVMEFTAINRTMGEEGRILGMFDKLLEEGKSTAPLRAVMLDEVLDLLLEARRYDDIALEMGDVLKKVDGEIRVYEDTAKHFKDMPDGPADYMKAQVAVEGGKYYEALLGAGKMKLARKLAKKLIRFDASGETYAILIGHAVQAGKVETARKLLAEGKEALPEEEHAELRRAAELIPEKGEDI